MIKIEFKKTGLTLLAAAMLAALGGCSTALSERVGASASRTQADAMRSRQAAIDKINSAERIRIAQQDVGTPWIAGTVMPLTREAQMPLSMKHQVTLTAQFATEAVDFQSALRQVAKAANINLVARPDALLPVSMFSPKIGGNQSGAVQAPLTVVVKANNMPIWQVLDDLAAQSQTSWRPTPTGAEFYRVETKNYEINTVAQKASASASLGKGNSGQNAFSSDSKTSFSLAENSRLDGLRTAVEAMMSVSGKMTLSPESQILTVTDTEAVHKQVEEYVKQQNKQFSRRIRMTIEAIEVVNKRGADVGLDWTAVINTATNALTLSSPGSLVSQQAAALGGQIMSGPMSGSGAVIKALNEVGVVVNRRVFPFVSMSGRPITQALRSTFNYVDQVQTTAVASSTTQAVQAPTVTQKDETVGTFLTIVPTAKTDGSIILSVSYDVTTADPLRPYTVGSGSSAVTVQQKTINGSGVVQEVMVRSGQTEVVGGVEISSSQKTARTVGEQVPMLFGGSESSGSQRSITVLLVTAVTEEGV